MIFNFIIQLAWILYRIPGFICGVGLGGYLWIACVHGPTGIPDPKEEESIREKVMKEWEYFPKEDEDSIDQQVYRCGWVGILDNYQENPPIDLNLIAKMKKSFKSPRQNIYFAVLKDGNLHLYESEEQKDPPISILSLDDCKVDLYPHTLLLDEIYKREYPLRIQVTSPSAEESSSQKVFYLYASGGSEKEDWLFALRQVCNSSKSNKSTSPNTPNSSISLLLQKDPKIADAIFMERLNRHVRSPQIDSSSQWLNAVAGRLFFNLFRSSDLERFFRTKFERKVSTAPKPFFLGDILLKSVHAGQSLPMFSSGQLHSVTTKGELLASIDIYYPGGFRMQIATEVKWDIPKLKSIVVPVVISVHVRKLSGRALLRIKPPPSDRLWFGFYALPQIDLDLEPVISSKALTWSPIKAAIMKHVNDQMMQHVVLPHMDDLTIPPLIIGDCYGGEKPFELDYLPPSLISQVKQLDYTAQGISKMPSPSPKSLASLSSSSPTLSPSILEKASVAGSSQEDLNVDISMDPIRNFGSTDQVSNSSTSSPASGNSRNLLEEAKRSDLLARERRGEEVKEKLIVSDYIEEKHQWEREDLGLTGESDSKTFSSTSTDSTPSKTREVFSSVRRSVSTFFRKEEGFKVVMEGATLRVQRNTPKEE